MPAFNPQPELVESFITAGDVINITKSASNIIGNTEMSLFCRVSQACFVLDILAQRSKALGSSDIHSALSEQQKDVSDTIKSIAEQALLTRNAPTNRERNLAEIVLNYS